MTDTKLIEDLHPFVGDEMIDTIIMALALKLLVNHLSAIQKATS